MGNCGPRSGERSRKRPIMRRINRSPKTAAPAAKKPIVPKRELDRMSPFGRDLAQGMIEAIEFRRGQGRARLSHVEAPPPAPRYTAGQIAAIRRKAGLTQSVFARAMNVSTTSVENWERGEKAPGPATRRLIQIASDADTLRDFAAVFSRSASQPAPKAERPAG
jgi:putative transcriptional regulator